MSTGSIGFPELRKKAPGSIFKKIEKRSKKSVDVESESAKFALPLKTAGAASKKKRSTVSNLIRGLQVELNLVPTVSQNVRCEACKQVQSRPTKLSFFMPWNECSEANNDL